MTFEEANLVSRCTYKILYCTSVLEKRESLPRTDTIESIKHIEDAAKELLALIEKNQKESIAHLQSELLN
jgi:hypothetical protein